MFTRRLKPTLQSTMSKIVLRTNATHAYVEDYSKGPMLRYQDSLPKLPVPALEETAVRYLKSVKAVATPEQYAKTEQALKEFLRGPGPKLQTKLLQKAADPEVKNWLADWWNDGAYLTYRDPVVPYVSYFYSHKDDKLRKTPASRAAAISTAAVSFKKQVDEKTLEPEYMKKMPLCMDAYKYMFNVCRVAYEGRDDAVVYPASENKHIIVIRKNKFYKVLHEIDGRELTTGELEVQFQRVIDLAGSDKGIAIGAMTSENRDKWAQFRKLLLAQGNESALKEIESASFVVCLDDSTPVTREERAHQYWHGDGQNRFYDKPVQFIICDNGASGFMGEHSMMDGTQTHRLNDYVCDVISNNKIEFPTADKGLVADTLAAPEQIKFNVNDEIKSAVETSINDFDKEINKHELAIFNYQGYGKRLIKQFKASPDGYVQMLLQLAYYKYYGVNRPTYESAATRRFQLGRTETCRSVSEESVKFCQTFEDPNATVEQKLSAVRNALAAHGKYITDASAGKGVDRHLFGLKKLVDPSEPLPSLYADPMYTYSSSWYISSSQLSSEHFNGYGWSQVIDDGFGLAYMINENSLNINIVSKKLGSEKMKHYLNEAADDMAQVFSTEPKFSKL